MTKKRKIILISVAVTLALVMTVGGLAYAALLHRDLGGHKLIGVSEMGFEDFEFEGGILGPTEAYTYYGETRGWDTQFIIINPNCERDLTIEWVALIAGEDTEDWDAGVIFEGPPDGEFIPKDLSPHQVWQVSLAEFIYRIEHGPLPSDAELYYFIASQELNKYTLEVTWSGVRYSWWWGWQRGRPLTGWQKEKCRHTMYGLSQFEVPGLPGEFLESPAEFTSLAISEAEMKLYPSRMRFSPPEPGPW